jgi:hypothetical protein
MFTFFHGCGIPPVTLTCGTGGGAHAQNVGPTGTQGCTQPGHCLGPTGTQGCTMTAPPNCLIGPTGTQGCTIVGPTGTQGCTQTTQPQTILPPTLPPACVPHTVGCTAITPCPTIPCPPAGNAQAQTIGVTGWQGCTVTSAQQHCLGPTGTQGCGQNNAQAQNVGITGWQGCIPPTGTPPATVCPQPTYPVDCPPGTAAMLCTQKPMCGPTHIGCTAYLHCPQPGTAATLCTQVTCDAGNAQAQTLGPTAYQGCPGTAATVCTQIGCGPTHAIGCTGYEGCIPPTGSGPATVCPGGDAQAQTLGHTAYEGCGQHGTEATVCTQIGCGPTHLLGCTGYEGCHSDGNAQAQVRSIPVADCIPTRSCTGAWPVC